MKILRFLLLSLSLFLVAVGAAASGQPVDEALAKTLKSFAEKPNGYVLTTLGDNRFSLSEHFFLGIKNVRFTRAEWVAAVGKSHPDMVHALDRPDLSRIQKNPGDYFVRTDGDVLEASRTVDAASGRHETVTYAYPKSAWEGLGEPFTSFMHAPSLAYAKKNLRNFVFYPSKENPGNLVVGWGPEYVRDWDTTRYVGRNPYHLWISGAKAEFSPSEWRPVFGENTELGSHLRGLIDRPAVSQLLKNRQGYHFETKGNGQVEATPKRGLPHVYPLASVRRAMVANQASWTDDDHAFMKALGRPRAANVIADSDYEVNPSKGDTFVATHGSSPGVSHKYTARQFERHEGRNVHGAVDARRMLINAGIIVPKR